MNLKVAKFTARIGFTSVLMIIGAVIFFTSDDNTLKILGSNMVTAGWASWMPTGSTKLKEAIKNKLSKKSEEEKLLDP